MTALWLAAQVAALVALALGMRRWLGRPELEHFVWLLVVLRLVVPASVEVPVVPARFAPEPVEALAFPSDDAAEPTTAVSLGPVGPLDVGELAAAPRASGGSMLPVAWLIATLLAFALLAAVALRFERRLRATGRSDARIDAELHRLGGRLGLARVPRAVVVDAAISPALWPLGRARMVVPREVADEWPAAEREGVLLHELAHYARRDHWVRIPEALCLCAWWWLPPVHWLRRQLRRAEEAACDARAVRALDGDRRSYADALVRTAEMLARPTAPRLPRLATGASPLDSLSRRLETIMKSPHPAPASRSRALLLLAGAALLPCVPGYARSTAALDPVAPTAAPSTGAPLDEEPEVSAKDAAAIESAMKKIRAGDLMAARKLLAQAAKDGGGPAIDRTRGQVAFQLGMMEDARAAYRAAVEAAPRYGRAWSELGTVEFQTGEYAAARESLRRAVDLGRGEARMYGFLGLVCSRLDDHAAAESAFWMASTLEPSERQWTLGLVDTFLQRGRHAEALALTERMLRETPEDESLQKLRVHALLALDRLDEAQLILEETLKDDVDSGRTEAMVETLLRLERIYGAQGSHQAASVCCQRAMELRPDDPRPYERLAHHQMQAGDLEGARTLLERAIALDPSRAERVSKLLEQLGGAPAAAPVTDLDVKPRPVSRPAPVVTEAMKAATPGRVIVLFIVDEEGRVVDPKVQESSNAALNHAALRAVKTWRFEPGTRGGEAVPFRMRTPINFPDAKTPPKPSTGGGGRTFGGR